MSDQLGVILAHQANYIAGLERLEKKKSCSSSTGSVQHRDDETAFRAGNSAHRASGQPSDERDIYQQTRAPVTTVGSDRGHRR